MKTFITLPVTVLSILVAGLAFADTRTANLTVSTTVLTPVSCVVSAGNTLDFGTYDTSVAAPTISKNTTVSVTCTSGLSYTLYPDFGANQSGSVRRMKDVTTGLNYLPYELFPNNTYAAAWTGTNKTTTTATGSPQQHTVYGRLAGGQLAADFTKDGIYSDTVVMTVEYTP